MVRSILAKIAFALPLLLAIPAVAQTHTFSFAAFSLQDPTAPFTLIDGNPANCGIGYCGLIQIRANENPWWGMECPQQNPDGTYGGWGCPNGGFLENNTVFPNESQIVWDNPGCGPKIAGCTGHTDTTIPFTGYGSGVTVTVHITYIVHFYPCRYRCYGNPGHYQTDNTGGSGTEVYNPPVGSLPILYPCGSLHYPCLGYLPHSAEVLAKKQ